ncbi:MAG TPA: hypothetical protein VLI04_20075 [Nocardioidaceae bacterium]|nr:hypothetical protein [Nocardioidaceae bacterium]
MIPTLLVLAMDADDAAAKVRPGWIPLIIVLLLGAFIAFLFFSLRKQLGKIDIPEGGVPTHPEESNGDSPTPAA